MPRRLLVSEDFWKKVEITTYCWIWKGAQDRSGYGIFGTTLSHRYSWKLHFCPIPKGLCVCHACDNPLCVNPSHLWLGTNTANHIDKDRKGRHRGLPKGSHISEEQKRKQSESMKGRVPWNKGRFTKLTDSFKSRPAEPVD